MIVLDTNALMMPVECDVRLFEELDRLLGGVPVDGTAVRPTTAGDGDPGPGVGTPEVGDPSAPELVVPTAVLAELDRLSEGAGAEATAASVGRDLAERCRAVEVETTEGDDAGADAAVLALGTSPACTHVVTNDGDLKRQLLERGVPVIGLRARHKLAITRP